MWKKEYVKKISKYIDQRLLIEYDQLFTGNGNWEEYLTPIEQDMLSLMGKEMDKRELKPLHLMNDQEFIEFAKKHLNK